MASLAGKLREAREFGLKRADVDTSAALAERAALTLVTLAETETGFGVADAARRDVAAAVKLAASRDVARQAALILAASGFPKEAQPLLNQSLKEYPPTDTMAKAVWIPAIRAALDLRHANATAAIDELQQAAPYDALEYGVVCLRASAYLAASRPADAAAEFQKVIDRAHGRTPYEPVARLGRARALAQTGDVAGSRTAYQDFFAAWKDADSGVPILVAAKQEYARLK